MNGIECAGRACVGIALCMLIPSACQETQQTRPLRADPTARFQPFTIDDLKLATPARDPKTPIALHDGSVAMPADEYLRQLNVLEKAVNSEGRSLREPDAEALARKHLTHVGPAITFSPVPPGRDVLQDWSSGLVGDRKLVAAQLGVKTTYDCQERAAVGTKLQGNAWFADQEFTVIDLGVSAQLKRPGTSEVAESVAKLTLFGKSIAEQKGTKFDVSIPFVNQELVNRPIIKINIWNNVVWVSVSVRASATVKGGVYGEVSGRPSAEARAYLEAALVARLDGTADLGGIIQLGLTAGADLLKFRVEQQAALVQVGAQGTYSSARNIHFIPISGAFGGVACIDLTPIGLSRFCAEFIVWRWTSLGTQIDLGEVSGECSICSETCGNRCGLSVCDGQVSCQCSNNERCKDNVCAPREECNPCKCADGWMPEEICCNARSCQLACERGGHGGKVCRSNRN
ncbi:hypothetical protein [Sorangium sp. So ce1078]|uniref:hypothetical protein n=1 Tax=Sorangium sp. So ce1078 TaxID=3133329 RepID=UPI003F621027